MTKRITLNDIKKLLPHRYPMLLIDRVLEINEDKIVCKKNLTVNEGFFQGHFDGYPIFPGVLAVEAMAQSIGILYFHNHPEIDINHSDYRFVLTSIKRAKFKKPMLPGDTLLITTTVDKIKKNIASCNSEISVDNELCVSANVISAMIKAENYSDWNG